MEKALGKLLAFFLFSSRANDKEEATRAYSFLFLFFFNCAYQKAPKERNKQMKNIMRERLGCLSKSELIFFFSFLSYYGLLFNYYFKDSTQTKAKSYIKKTDLASFLCSLLQRVNLFPSAGRYALSASSLDH